MKVIEVGNKNNCTMRITCEKCEAVLEIESADLTKLPDGRGFDKVYAYTCPCCNKTQYLVPNQLSKGILSEMTN